MKLLTLFTLLSLASVLPAYVSNYGNVTPIYKSPCFDYAKCLGSSECSRFGRYVLWHNYCHECRDFMNIYDQEVSDDYKNCINHWFLTKFNRPIQPYNNQYYRNYWSRDVAYKKRNINRVFLAPYIRPDNTNILL